MDEISRDDYRAALGARRELGPDMEDALVESFAEKVESAIARREAAQPPAAPAARPRSLALAIVSVVMGASMLPVGLESTRGSVMLVVMWMGIVLVNLVYNRGA